MKVQGQMIPTFIYLLGTLLIKNQSENPFNIVSGRSVFQNVASKY